MSIAIMRGPPAIPNFIGTGIFGTANGMLPNNIPSIIPMKIVAIFGWSRRLMAFPTRLATRLTDASSPTTIIRSPT